MQDFLCSHIHINMNYLVSTFACVMVGDKKFTIEPYCKYSIERVDSTSYIVFGHNGESPFIFDFESNKNVLMIRYKNDNYYYLKNYDNYCFTTQIKFLSHIVNVTISDRLYITIDGEKISNENVINIEYSHYEIRKNYLVIFFKGVRDYVVIIKDKEFVIGSFYDEINIVDGELIFMCRCMDCLNHGKVFYLNKNNEYDSYLVYLDNDNKELKDEFVPLVFLDAILVGNYKYANNLLDDTIRLDDGKKLVEFFDEFDEYLVLDDAFALLKKNTLAGIYSFEVSNTRIINIIPQHL